MSAICASWKLQTGVDLQTDALGAQAAAVVTSNIYMNIRMHLHLGQWDVNAQISANIKNKSSNPPKDHRTHPHIVSKLLYKGAEGQKSKRISTFRCMNAHNLPFLLAER